MDFIVDLPPSKGCTVIMVVFDLFSKGIHLASLASGFTVYKVADIFVSIVWKHKGLPKSIIFYHDLVFIGHFLRDLFQIQWHFITDKFNISSLNRWSNRGYESHYRSTLVSFCACQNFLVGFLSILGWVLLQHLCSCCIRFVSIPGDVW